jgi:DNA-directed RNA polymerase specialized sigma24 family protein
MNVTTYSPNNLEVKVDSNRIKLYERYGAMAYGVILQIIPEKDLAQRILIDLFSSSQIEELNPEATQGVASSIIRQARSKALAARKTTSSNTDLFVSTTTAPGNNKQAKFVFNLAFCQGFTPETIAQRLQIPYSVVMQAIHEYFLFLRTS